MTPKQFDLAMTQLTMSEGNRQAAHLFFVEGKTVVQMQNQHGVSASRLSKILKRVVSNYEKQLDAHDLVSSEYMLDAATAKLVREIETSQVNQAQIKPYSGSTATKKKAKTKLSHAPVKKADGKAKEKAIEKGKAKIKRKAVNKKATKKTKK